MDWARDFYSLTDRWWGKAESAVDDADRNRAAIVADLANPGARILELGCGSGSTAIATAERDFTVTGIDFSDRIDRAAGDAAIFVKADFYRHDFATRFDVVTYWDGFGVGTDDDQLRLLQRIANDWLQPAGLAVIEIFDPAGFVQDDGMSEVCRANQAAGYHHDLGHKRSFDPATMRALDTWWSLDDGVEWSQSLRCYSVADFEALVGQSDLCLSEVLEVGRSPWSYLAVLTPPPPTSE